MFRNKKAQIILIIIAVAAVFFFISSKNKNNKSSEVMVDINPVLGNIEKIISTTGTVLPKNRLEIKPPVSGRLEQILVKEGDKVTLGQTIAWLSSTERAALLDAARGEGEEKLKDWEDIYKAIPLISPIDGEVIVAKIQPGQSLATADAVVVLSDKLIVRAQVDETDIGKIKLNQKAVVSLDAYPDVSIKAKVEHIYYESKLVSNVTTYEVDLILDEITDIFRSGMNASIDFVEASRENVLTVPLEAVIKENNESYVLVKNRFGKPSKTLVNLGIADDKNIEITSGIDINTNLVVKSKKFALPKSDIGKNPFLPNRNERNKKK